MVSSKARNTYQHTEAQAEIDPAKLIHLLYERALLHLELAEKAIREDNPKNRGENLGKGIAIVTELLASVKEGDDSEVADFLSGLYKAILVELPKVSMTNDLAILQRAHSYIAKLKEIWEQSVMPKTGNKKYEASSGETADLRQYPLGSVASERSGVSVSI
ncbi:MAG: flagellar export chaperone FliS [Deltaproteobacteria bacterium RIFOXYD12_FULL_50_9]|nr:MAG: flagellar export chaperone FliS [Deltaproteobacteria bacterium RIFOXYD12_FULL_50_9]